MKCFSLFFIFISLFGHSQNFTSKWFNVDNGLAQNSIKDIIKDKYGFIWLTTENGIIRYDGNKFQAFNIKGLENMHFKDFQGNISKDSILAVNAEQENTIIITERSAKITNNKVVNNRKEKDNIFYKRIFKNLKKMDASSMYEYYTIKTPLGFYYFGKNISQFSNNNEESKKNLINNINQDVLTNLFVHGNYVFIGDYKNSRTIILFEDKVQYINGKSLYNDPQSRIFWNEITGQVFVINKGNIYISQFKNGKLSLKKILYYPDFDKEYYYSMYYDEKYQKLYLGTFTKGLNIITISNFSTSLRNKPFDDNVFYSALPFTQNSIITSEGTEYFNNKSKKIYDESTLEKVAIIYDKSGNLLYLKNNTIQKRDKKFGYQKAESILHKDKHVLYIFNTEQIFAASLKDNSSNYLYIFEEDNFKKIKSILPFKTNVLSVAKLGQDFLYVGCRDGLYLVSISKNKILSKIIGNVVVRQIVKTKDNNIWITTANSGFYLIKNNFAIRMPEDKNHYLSQAHYLLEDNKSNLWITSNQGLFKVKKKMLLDYAIHKKTDVSYYRYTKESGFLTNEFNGGCNIPGNELKDGQFVFPSLEGLVFFKPNEVKSYYPNANEVFVESGFNGKEKFSFNKKLILKSNYENLTLNIDIPYYFNFDNIQLEAKLLGEDNNTWEKISKQRQYILKNNLNPGKYKLVIRFLTSNDGRFEYKTIPIEILPFFYQTTWFKFSILLLVISILIFIIYRDRKLNKELEIKNTSLETTANQLKNQTYYQKELLSSISHDITTPLKFITNLSKQLKSTEDLETQKEYFDSISKSSEQLYKFTKELRKYSELFSEENLTNNEGYKLYNLIEDKKLLFEEMAKQKGVALENLTDVNLKLTLNKNILGAILHNLIDNAVKYTPKGSILINSLETSTSIQIHVMDTGNQMSNEQIKYYTSLSTKQDNGHSIYKNYGLGLHMVIQLIKKINAEIKFEKNTPKGMVIKVTLPKE